MDLRETESKALVLDDKIKRPPLVNEEGIMLADKMRSLEFDNAMVQTLDEVIAWCRKNSIWPVMLGLTVRPRCRLGRKSSAGSPDRVPSQLLDRSFPDLSGGSHRACGTRCMAARAPIDSNPCKRVSAQHLGRDTHAEQ
jgi:hypothetical protein